MTEPLKLWDKVGVNSQNVNSEFVNQMSSNSNEKPATQARQTPLVPPRPTNAVLPYNSYYTNNCNYPYGSGNPNMNYYGGFPFGGSMNYGGYYNSPAGSGFVQQAEMNSRQAFQSVETIVRTFSSVSVMMESTLQAVMNSFRTVIGVVDQFSRMQTYMSQIYSTITVIRFFKWLLKKLTFFRKLRTGHSNLLDEEIWTESENATKVDRPFREDMPEFRSNWPALLFFTIVIGGPLLLWKFVSALKTSEKGNWADGSAEHYTGVVEFDFVGQRDDEVTLKRGTKVFIAPKNSQPPTKGWALVSTGSSRIGLIPQNYVKVTGKIVDQKTVQCSNRTEIRKGQSYPPEFSTIFSQSEICPVAIESKESSEAK